MLANPRLHDVTCFAMGPLENDFGAVPTMILLPRGWGSTKSHFILAGQGKATTQAFKHFAGSTC